MRRWDCISQIRQAKRGSIGLLHQSQGQFGCHQFEVIMVPLTSFSSITMNYRYLMWQLLVQEMIKPHFSLVKYSFTITSLAAPCVIHETDFFQNEILMSHEITLPCKTSVLPLISFSFHKLRFNSSKTLPTLTKKRIVPLLGVSAVLCTYNQELITRQETLP